jgi:hypothetical protein
MRYCSGTQTWRGGSWASAQCRSRRWAIARLAAVRGPFANLTSSLNWMLVQPRYNSYANSTVCRVNDYMEIPIESVRL